MNIKITAEKENPVLQRRELKMDVDFGGKPTPKCSELAAEVAKLKGCDAKLVEVTKFATASGFAGGEASVKVWNSAEAAEKFKAHKRKKQTKPAEGAAPAPAAPVKKIV
jgi:ribosomal protein S24E